MKARQREADAIEGDLALLKVMYPQLEETLVRKVFVVVVNQIPKIMCACDNRLLVD